MPFTLVARVLRLRAEQGADAAAADADPAAAALLHVSRTVVRRAERSTWALIEQEPDTTNREPVLYLNRLSDLLFILSRIENPGGDVLWAPGASR